MGAVTEGLEISTGTTRLIMADDVLALSNWNEAIEALRAAYGGHIDDDMVPPRSMARGEGIWMRGLTAVSTSGEHIGAKLITVARGEGSPHASYLVALFDRHTARLTTLMDGNHITGLRTAATSAVFAAVAAPPRELRVAVLGSGFEAFNHLAALREVRPLASATVFSPRDFRREAFAERALRELGVATEPRADARSAVDGADLVLCAARSHNEQPILRGAWLAPGVTVISIGSTLPEQREVDAETLMRADLIVADMVDEVVHDTGDFIAAREAGHDVPPVVALADVVSRRHPGRESADQIVLYKSVGSALQDIVVAELIQKKANELGVGQTIQSPIHPVAR